MIREGIALRLHAHDRSLLKVVYEQSSLNCGWDDLPDYWKERYREDALNFIFFLASHTDEIFDYLNKTGYTLTEPL